MISVEHRSNNRGTQSNLYTIYDTGKLWNAKNVTEMQSISSELKDAEIIDYLRSRGYNVTKKEPALCKHKQVSFFVTQSLSPKLYVVVA